MADQKRMGLVLRLGGAAENWHTVNTADGEVVPGLFHPTIPLEPQEVLGLSADEVERLLERTAGRLELVEIPKGEIRRSIDTAKAAIESGGRAALLEARKRPGEQTERARAERIATAAARAGVATATEHEGADPEVATDAAPAAQGGDGA